MAAEDRYGIEVWDLEEKALVETLSRASDFSVSLAAWYASIRRRPGVMLIHRNGPHVMERLRTPGAAPAEPSVRIDGLAIEGFDISLRDLRSWHRLRAMRTSCGHHKSIGADVLGRKYGIEVRFATLETKLRCSGCRKGPVRLEIHNAPRD